MPPPGSPELLVEVPAQALEVRAGVVVGSCLSRIGVDLENYRTARKFEPLPTLTGANIASTFDWPVALA